VDIRCRNNLRKYHELRKRLWRNFAKPDRKGMAEPCSTGTYSRYGVYIIHTALLTDIPLAEILLADHVKILDTILDCSLTKAVSKSCFYHIRSFRQMRSSLDDNTALSVATALVSSSLDYANSILFGSNTTIFNAP